MLAYRTPARYGVGDTPHELSPYSLGLCYAEHGYISSTASWKSREYMASCEIEQLTSEAYNLAVLCTCLCRPKQLRQSGLMHILRILSQVQHIRNDGSRHGEQCSPFTTGSHSFNARAFVLFSSVSSSRRESVFMTLAPKEVANTVSGVEQSAISESRTTKWMSVRTRKGREMTPRAYGARACLFGNSVGSLLDIRTALRPILTLTPSLTKTYDSEGDLINLVVNILYGFHVYALKLDAPTSVSTRRQQATY